ncbi:hypothetical protein ColTof4_06365 [Colletotrichum tofieldiae]|uniref:Uncharacterized protein n=1 Tax=Colletotrichum tofieldiae TaxID=708197 RepID=A0A166TWB7_9PEZI|nr:hypothetical protein CT0861_09380 [Colletotrichum tofieldiae]GKT54212.1 hypothetical protein ColTof3_01551 [Colletotrichum tofieldiae]GKT73942.1 hypothetical protein ColTof4_06365 [Colletotrichum tofieldiae]GKT95913.1 hypothetical protein Ct61P_13763 [Colletotrichum tofieldiae]
MAFDDKYHDEKARLSSDDNFEDEDCPSLGRKISRKRSRQVPLWAFVISTSLALVLAIALAYTTLGLNKQTRGSGYDFDGYVCAPDEADPEEALARGCAFDTFTMQWYPRDRYSRNESVELMRRFTDMGWPRYFDKEGIRPIKDLERAPKSIYILMKEHLWHCGYSIMQTHLWITLGMDPPEAYEHTEHCVMSLLDVIEKNPPPGFNEIKFNTRTSLVPSEYGNVKPHYPCAEKGFACRSDP